MTILPAPTEPVDEPVDYTEAHQIMTLCHERGEITPAIAYLVQTAEEDRKRGERIDALLDQAEAFGEQMASGSGGGMLGMLGPLLGGLG